MTIEIPAILEPDDGSSRVEFDAADWFRVVAIPKIVQLSRDNWGGYEADEVAYCATRQPEVATIFEYLDAANAVRRQMNPTNFAPLGFECHVDAVKARAWLQVNRPDAYTALVNENLYAACQMALTYWEAYSPRDNHGPTEQDDWAWAQRAFSAAAKFYEPTRVQI